jgi:hypothetical protein
MSEPYRGITMSGEFNPEFQSGAQPPSSLGQLNAIFVDVPNSELYVSDDNDTVYVFPRLANQGAFPIRVLAGAATTLDNPEEMFVDDVHDELVVPNFDTSTVTVYPRTANGNVAPIRTLHAVSTPGWGGLASVWIDLVNDEMLVASTGNYLWVFARTAVGDATPLRTITGGATGLNDTFQAVTDNVNDEIVAVNSTGNSVTVYPRTGNGNIAPLRTIAGAATQLNGPSAINVDTVNNLYSVTNSGGNSITVYNRTDIGNVAPLREIVGAATTLNGPLATSLDVMNGEIYAANFTGQSVAVFPYAGTGNIAPIRSMTNANISAATVLRNAQKQSWSALTPWHIFFRPCMSTSADGSTSTTDFPTLLFVIDRERSGWMSVFLYPSNTEMGASNPWQATVFAADTNVFMGDGGGNVTCQPMRTLAQPDILGLQPIGQQAPAFARFTPDTLPGGVAGSGANVTSTWRSRYREQGSPNALKQARDVFVTGTCVSGSGSVVLNVMDGSGNMVNYLTATGLTFPTGVAVPLDGISNYYRSQLELVADQMYVNSATISFRQRMLTGTAQL